MLSLLSISLLVFSFGLNKLVLYNMQYCLVSLMLDWAKPYFHMILLVIYASNKHGKMYRITYTIPWFEVSAKDRQFTHYLFPSRRGEEHSFILKPAIMSSRDRRINSDVPLTLSLPKMSGTATNTSTPRVSELSAGLTDQYAVLISYRCNYTGELLEK